MASVNENNTLLVKYAAGEASAAEAQQARSWIEASVDNKKEFEKTLQLIQLSSGIIVPEIDEDAAWTRFRSGMTTTPAPIKKISPILHWTAAAAIILLLAGGYIISQHTSTKSTLAPAPTELTRIFSNEINEALANTLPDGSIITLYKNSNISYQKNDQRNIQLQGDALFVVAPNAHQPFTVTVKDTKILVLGTSFTVKSSSSPMEIHLLTGSVNVMNARFHQMLRPGERLLLSNTSWILAADTIPANEKPKAKKKKSTPPVKPVEPSDPQSPTKAVQPIAPKPVHIPKKATPPQGPTVAAQKQLLRNVLRNFVDDHLVSSWNDVISFALNEDALVINGQKQASDIYKTYKAKYLTIPGVGLYYGPVTMHGTGIFMNKEDLQQ